MADPDAADPVAEPAGAEPAGAAGPSAGVRVVPVEVSLVEALAARRWTIAIAESLTGGQVNARVCSTPGGGEVVLGGIVSYSTEAKRAVLGVTAERVVSAEAATQMATGVRALFGADVGLSSTGVAGPDRQEGQPVGTLFVGWSVPERSGATRLSCVGTPDQIKQNGTEMALRLLLDHVQGEALDAPPGGTPRAAAEEHDA